MSSVDGLMAAMTRDIEASAQFVSKVWLHSFYLAERRMEVILSAASATAESLDGSRAGAGYPPALLFAMGLRRDAFEEQCRAYLELAWMGARMAAQQRVAFARAASEGMLALNAIARTGIDSAPGLDGERRARADERSGRRPRRKPALRSAIAVSGQASKAGRAGGEGAPPRKTRPTVVLRSVSPVPSASARHADADPAPPADETVSVAGGGQNG